MHKPFPVLVSNNGPAQSHVPSVGLQVKGRFSGQMPILVGINELVLAQIGTGSATEDKNPPAPAKTFKIPSWDFVTIRVKPLDQFCSFGFCLL